jgi:hypothetical protein
MGWTEFADRKPLYFSGGTSMATKKKTTSKKGKIRDLPKAKKELTEQQARTVKGGFAPMGKAGLDGH